MKRLSPFRYLTLLSLFLCESNQTTSLFSSPFLLRFSFENVCTNFISPRTELLSLVLLFSIEGNLVREMLLMLLCSLFWVVYQLFFQKEAEEEKRRLFPSFSPSSLARTTAAYSLFFNFTFTTVTQLVCLLYSILLYHPI